jgi:hypothetical protein
LLKWKNPKISPFLVEQKVRQAEVVVGHRAVVVDGHLEEVEAVVGGQEVEGAEAEGAEAEGGRRPLIAWSPNKGLLAEVYASDHDIGRGV